MLYVRSCIKKPTDPSPIHLFHTSVYVRGVPDIHSLDIIITDLKPDNILLVHDAHSKNHSYSKCNGPINARSIIESATSKSKQIQTVYATYVCVNRMHNKYQIRMHDPHKTVLHATNKIICSY
eukprot:806508_1